MKKTIFQASIFLLSLSMGIGLAALVFFNLDVYVPVPGSLSPVTDPSGFPGLSKEIRRVEGSKNGYLPENTGLELDEDIFEIWHTPRFAAMKEKSLLDISNKDLEVYRFLWLRSFDDPIFVRVVRSGTEIHLVTKELKIEYGRKPQKAVRSFERNLSESEWDELLQKLQKARFWEMPTGIDDIDPDGAAWILEGVRDERYHQVDRHSPEQSAYRDACIYLLNLSGFKPDDQDSIY